MKHYGVDFLHSVNRGKLSRFAEGGLVSNPRPRTSSQVNQQAGTLSTAGNGRQEQVTGPVIQQTLVLDSAEVFSAGLKTVSGQRSMMTFIRANKATLKQELGN